MINHLIMSPIKPTLIQTSFFWRLHYYDDVVFKSFFFNSNTKTRPETRGLKSIQPLSKPLLRSGLGHEHNIFEVLVSDSDIGRDKVMRSDEDTESDKHMFENLGLEHAYEHGFG